MLLPIIKNERQIISPSRIASMQSEVRAREDLTHPQITVSSAPTELSENQQKWRKEKPIPDIVKRWH